MQETKKPTTIKKSNKNNNKTTTTKQEYKMNLMPIKNVYITCLTCTLPCLQNIYNTCTINKYKNYMYLNNKGLRGSDVQRHFQQYFSYISWRSVLLVEETVVPGENHRHSPTH